MASSSVLLNEELQCSICLDVFTDPVTTPCGHNFCRTCLDQYWTNTHTCCCPICKEKFSKQPDLKVNTTLREVVQHFNQQLSLGESEVLCDICEDRKQKAVKSCLTCQSSYCENHLEPHYRVPRLKKHTLISAVENLEDYICPKHERPLELFCRDDQMCVCLSCTLVGCGLTARTNRARCSGRKRADAAASAPESEFLDYDSPKGECTKGHFLIWPASVNLFSQGVNQNLFQDTANCLVENTNDSKVGYQFLHLFGLLL